MRVDPANQNEHRIKPRGVSPDTVETTPWPRSLSSPRSRSPGHLLADAVAAQQALPNIRLYNPVRTRRPIHLPFSASFVLCFAALPDKCRKRPIVAAVLVEREFFVGNLLVRINFIIVMIRWTGLAPWEFEFSFSGSLEYTFLVEPRNTRAGWRSGLRRKPNTRNPKNWKEKEEENTNPSRP